MRNLKNPIKNMKKDTKYLCGNSRIPYRSIVPCNKTGDVFLYKKQLLMKAISLGFYIHPPPPPPVAQQPLVSQGLLIIEASRSQSDTPHSVGLLWSSDQPNAETST
jgi:hypothetical protein